MKVFKLHRTKYAAVWVQEEDGCFWIVETDTGSDEFIGKQFPTEHQIRAFAKAFEV